MTETLFPILYARDLGRVARFYRDLIGMREAFRHPAEGEAVFLTLRWGNAELGLGTYDPTPGLEGRPLIPPGAGRGFELCLYVPDVDGLGDAHRPPSRTSAERGKIGVTSQSAEGEHGPHQCR